MNALTELRTALIQKISSIDDPAILESFLSWIESRDNEAVRLSNDQMEAIDDSMSQVQDGLYTDHSDLIAKARQWLNEE